MKVRSLNKQQIFVSGLMDTIIYELSHPLKRNTADMLLLIDEAEMLRQLCNRLEHFKMSRDEENETIAFVNFLSDSIIEMVPNLSVNNKVNEIGAMMRAYSRIYLCDVLKDDFNASALITELIICKQKTLKSKWMSTNPKNKVCIDLFVLDINTIIHKLEPLVV